MLKNPAGVILVMTKNRFLEVRHDLAVKDAFVEVLPLSLFHGPSRAVAIIVVDSYIIAAAAFHAAGHRATELRRVRISDLVSLDIPFQRVIEGQIARSRAKIDQVKDLGGFLPKEIWPGFWSTIRSLTAATAALDALEYKVFHVEDEMKTRSAELHRLERDKIGLASEMAGFNRSEILELFPLAPPPIPCPALQTLTRRTAIEDTYISHDAQRFPTFQKITDDPSGAVTLSNKKGERLHIINVNRTKIEVATGADLVYFSEPFSSAVLVQYKLFNYGDHPERKSTKAYYRLTESDKEQLQKLQLTRQALDVADERRLQDYRLGAECIFYKLCHRCAPDSASDLVAGIYFSIEHWERLLRAPISVGIRGAASAIGYENSDRHLNNTEFTALVRGGWIGSRATPPERLQQIVDDLLGSGRSVTVAYKENPAAGGPEKDSLPGLRARQSRSRKKQTVDVLPDDDRQNDLAPGPSAPKK